MVVATETEARTVSKRVVCIPLECCLHRPQRSWAKVMFLQESVILSTEGGLSASMHVGIHPSKSRHPLKSRHPPRADTPTPTAADTSQEQTPPKSRHEPPRADTHPQEQTPPQRADTPSHTVNERLVPILLECILVLPLHVHGKKQKCYLSQIVICYILQ